MPDTKSPKPNVTIAKVTNVYYDFHDATYDISLSDKKTFAPLQTIYISKTDGPIKIGDELVLWTSINGVRKFIATKDRIIEPKYGVDVLLDAVTKKHFEDYQKQLIEQQKIKKNIEKTKRVVSIIKSIKTEKAEDQTSIEAAKKALLDYLDQQNAIDRSKIVSKIPVK